LVPEYEFRAEKIVLTDPSAKLLKIARSKFTSRKFKFIQASIQSLKQKVKRHTFDLVVIVRVLHHIEDVEGAMEFIHKVLKPGGFVILEFPNKKHIKASVKQFLKGNTTYTIDISKKNLNSKHDTLPFFNYHPDYIKKLLSETGFKVIEKRSVSNVRSKRVKSMVSPAFLHTIEKNTQTFLSSFDFGPSIFVLAQKKKGKL
jgi:ubiquinone/menaquinone biosynthesis C-methylase UbiE